MIKKSERLIISRDGTARGLHGPAVDAVTRKLGDPEIRRASHVEPGAELSPAALQRLLIDSGVACLQQDAEGYPIPRIRPELAAKWFADLTPVDKAADLSPVLGPFNTRAEALLAEETWLKDRNIPVCDLCRGK